LNAAYASSNTAENLATILEPLLIVLMGGAVMLPIIELNQMVR
jgi:type II secretory pathway component PulF